MLTPKDTFVPGRGVPPFRYTHSTDAGEVESQFPLGLEFGLFAEPDSNLPRLAVDVDFGITSLLQLDAHDESNGKFLLGDAPIRLK